MSSESQPKRGWVLYDAACGFCRQWVPFWAETLRRRGFEIAPLQSQWVKDQFKLPDEELSQDLRLLFIDGRQVQGAEVYRQVMRRIWWAYPIYLFASAPGLRRIFDWAYRTFATNRFGFSRACGLPNLPASSNEDSNIPPS